MAGSGDDVQAASPRWVVSVLSPTSRYALPFVRHIARQASDRVWLVAGRGSFGRQVILGAETSARKFGLSTVRIDPDDSLPRDQAAAGCSLFCAGTFEEDVSRVDEALGLPEPPRFIGAVAAGVQEFGQAVTRPNGIFGVAQWTVGNRPPSRLGPAEPDFLQAYSQLAGAAPDYPAVQAAAAAALAVHCARSAGSLERDALWATAVELRTTTMFGDFQIDPATGAQLAHETVLVRWSGDRLNAVAPE